MTADVAVPARSSAATSPHGGLYAMPSLCGNADATREWFRTFAKYRPRAPGRAGHLGAHWIQAKWPDPYILSGEAGTWYGDRLEHHRIAKAGDFVYIASGVPHLPYNRSDDEELVAVIARTDPKEQESVVLMPELDLLRREPLPAEVG